MGKFENDERFRIVPKLDLTKRKQSVVKEPIESVVSPEEEKPKDPQPLLPHKAPGYLLQRGKLEQPDGVREAWTDQIERPKNRSRWTEQTPLDANVFSQFTPMENSDGSLPNEANRLTRKFQLFSVDQIPNGCTPFSMVDLASRNDSPSSRTRANARSNDVQRHWSARVERTTSKTESARHALSFDRLRSDFANRFDAGAAQDRRTVRTGRRSLRKIPSKFERFGNDSSDAEIRVESRHSRFSRHDDGGSRRR